MRIGELSERTGEPRRLLRYYQEQGLLPSAREPNGYRDFNEDSVDQVKRIRALLSAGLSTASIHLLLPCFTSHGGQLQAMSDPAMADNLARELAALESRIRVLEEQAGIIRGFLAEATRFDLHTDVSV